MDFRKILKASFIPIIVLLIFNDILLPVFSYIFSFFFAFDLTIFSLIGSFLLLLTYSVNLMLYAYAAYRAVKKFQASAIEAGMVSAFSFLLAFILDSAAAAAFPLLTHVVPEDKFYVLSPFSRGILFYLVSLLIGFGINFALGALIAFFTIPKKRGK